MPRDDYRKLIDERFDRVDDKFAGITKLFHAHFENMNDKLDEVIKHQKESNNRTSKLEDRTDNIEGWRDEFEGGRKAKQAILTTIWTIVVIASSLIAIMSFVKGTNNVRELQIIENKLRDKQDKIPDSTVRAGNFLPITQDSAYIKKLEKEYERLVK